LARINPSTQLKCKIDCELIRKACKEVKVKRRLRVKEKREIIAAKKTKTLQGLQGFCLVVPGLFIYYFKYPKPI